MLVYFLQKLILNYIVFLEYQKSFADNHDYIYR